MDKQLKEKNIKIYKKHETMMINNIINLNLLNKNIEE